jgi:hypothetical protein
MAILSRYCPRREFQQKLLMAALKIFIGGKPPLPNPRAKADTKYTTKSFPAMPTADLFPNAIYE